MFHVKTIDFMAFRSSHCGNYPLENLWYYLKFEEGKMNPIFKLVAGILLVLIGVIMIFFSRDIARQIEEGREQVNAGQSRVDSGNALFSVHPYTKQVGQQFTRGAQQKIDAGNEQIAYYSQFVSPLQIGGIVILLLGVAFVFFARNLFWKW